MLKIAGVKSEKEFYKKFPTEEAFMAKHGKALKKAQIGAYMTSGEAPAPFVPLDVYEMQSDINYAMTGMTDAERKELAAIQAQQANQSQGGSNQIMQMLSGLAESGAAKKGKKIPKAQPGFQQYANTQFGFQGTPRIPTGGLPRTQIPTAQQLTAGMPSQTIKPSATPTAAATGSFDVMPFLGAATNIIQGAQMLEDQRNELNAAEQQAALSGVFSQAAMSRPVQQPRRQYVRPEDVILQPQQMFPSYGVGTNVLAQDGAMIGGNPTEIQNMYNPGTLYTDLGYEPLNDTNKVKNFKKGGKLKQAQSGNWMQGTGFGNFMTGSGGAGLQNIGMSLGVGDDAGGSIGKGLGTAAGTLLGGPVGGVVGGLLGGALGDVFDPYERKMRGFQQTTQRNINNIMGQSAGYGIQNQFGRNLQDGGTTSPYAWMSHTWQPQVITTFGEHKLKDLLKAPKDADMLRAGGHLKEYTPPSARAMFTGRPDMQMGGELETHWGGYAETLSENPYLPDGGETIMFRGQSHDESDGKGNTGIGITYGDNPVEVERGEPAVKLQDGTTGDSSLTVFGNIKITNAFADMLADPKAKGKKFKTYVADLSKQENKQNNLIDKSVEQLDSLDVQTSFDKLALGTLQANMEGANAKLKDLAKKKMDAAALQNAINDTKEEELVKITDKGDVLAKKGANIPKAQKGLTARADVPKQSRSDLGYGNITKADMMQMQINNPWYNWSSFDPTNADDVLDFQKAFNRKAESLGSSARLQEDSKLGQQTVSARGLYGGAALTDLPRIALPNVGYTLPTPSATPSQVKRPAMTADSSKTNLLPFLSQALQQLRPSDVEPLSSNQLLGEMYALSQNQVEPVPAQKFIPELGVPMDISLQDILNENQAAYNATQRLVGYNPAALASLNAQKYAANQRVLGEQFRLNQAEKQRVYSENRNLLNQAKLQNLQILDTQAQRQAQALSNTKATTQAALNSIASKYAQNKLENRTLAVYENMYNYRYDPNFRLQNMQLAQFNIPTVGSTTASTSDTKKAKGGKTVKKNNLNSSIVKALKNI